MALQNVRLSVGKTWRFVADDNGATTTSTDLTGYREELDHLKGVPAGPGFSLPWPPYPSRFWENMFGKDYDQTRTEILVGALLPMLMSGNLNGFVDGARANLQVDAFLHPFALTTVVHFDFEEPWGGSGIESSYFDSFLRRPVSGVGLDLQVRDGLTLKLIEDLPATDARGRPALLTPTGGFLLLSGLHQEAPDPLALASSLASLFDSSERDRARRMKSGDTGIATNGDNVGLVLPRNRPNAGRKIECLHRNLTILMSYIQNLSTLVSTTITPSTRWFQDRAGALLNRFYWRKDETQGARIYRSRLAELWIKHQGLARGINAITARSNPGLLPIPE